MQLFNNRPNGEKKQHGNECEARRWGDCQADCADYNMLDNAATAEAGYRVCINCAEAMRTESISPITPDQIERAEREAFGNVCGGCIRSIEGRLSVAERDADGWPRCNECAASPTATIVECADELAGPHASMTFSPGWGYRIDATGEVVNGGGDGEIWQEGEAEANAVAAGFEVDETLWTAEGVIAGLKAGAVYRIPAPLAGRSEQVEIDFVGAERVYFRALPTKGARARDTTFARFAGYVLKAQS